MADIISLTIKNFRSYKDEATFTFEAVSNDAFPGNYHDIELANGQTIRLLNSAVFYGANAAGKSTIITGFLALSSFVNNSDRYKPKRKLTYEPFIFSEETKNAPVCLSIEFVLNKEIYTYKISYNETAFISEELSKKDGNIVLLQRDETGCTNISKELRFEVTEATYPQNHLAISELVLKAKEGDLLYSINEVFSSIETVQMSQGYSSDYTIQEAAQIIHEDPHGVFGNLISELITDADTGILNVTVSELTEQDYGFPDAIPESAKSRLMENHPFDVRLFHETEEGGKESLSIDFESEGTKTLFTAGTLVIKALQEGSFLAYDEMNNALHPLLFRRLVSLFHNKETNPKNAQLLVTTHDPFLIDEPRLRADQVWFVEKKGGKSNIFSAIDFDELSIDEPFGPWYRSGRLGARPNLKAFDNMMFKE